MMKSTYSIWPQFVTGYGLISHIIDLLLEVLETDLVLSADLARIGTPLTPVLVYKLLCSVERVSY